MVTSLCRVEQRSPAIFTGGGHEFVSEIGLFRQVGLRLARGPSLARRPHWQPHRLQ